MINIPPKDNSHFKNPFDDDLFSSSNESAALEQQSTDVDQQSIGVDQQSVEGEQKLNNANADKIRGSDQQAEGLDQQEDGLTETSRGRDIQNNARKNEEAALGRLNVIGERIVDGSIRTFRSPKNEPQFDEDALILLEPGEDPHMDDLVAVQDPKTEKLILRPGTKLSERYTAFDKKEDFKFRLFSKDGTSLKDNVSVSHIFSEQQFKGIRKAYHIAFKIFVEPRSKEDEKKAQESQRQRTLEDRRAQILARNQADQLSDAMKAEQEKMQRLKRYLNDETDNQTKKNVEKQDSKKLQNANQEFHNEKVKKENKKAETLFQSSRRTTRQNEIKREEQQNNELSSRMNDITIVSNDAKFTSMAADGLLETSTIDVSETQTSRSNSMVHSSKNISRLAQQHLHNNAEVRGGKKRRFTNEN